MKRPRRHYGVRIVPGRGIRRPAAPVDGLFYDRHAIDRLDLIVQAEILDLAPDLMEIVNLLPPGYYDRQSLCDQLNSALAAHGWGAIYGTVE